LQGRDVARILAPVASLSEVGAVGGARGLCDGHSITRGNDRPEQRGIAPQQRGKPALVAVCGGPRDSAECAQAPHVVVARAATREHEAQGDQGLIRSPHPDGFERAIERRGLGKLGTVRE